MNPSTSQLIRAGVKPRGQVSVQKANAKRVKLCGEYDSKAEALYADRLDLMQRAGEIRKWWPHPFTLKLGDGAKYTPDFMISHNDGSVEIVEIKGHGWAAGMLRFKWAATLYELFDWSMVRREGRAWTTIKKYSRGKDCRVNVDLVPVCRAVDTVR